MMAQICALISSPNPRTQLIKSLHVAKAKLGLDDDTYRAMLQSQTGLRSAKDCSLAQLKAVQGHLNRLGYKTHPKAYGGPAKRLVAKIRALWISGWNLQVVRDPSDKAMEAFILRQTGLASASWLHNPNDAAKVIDALKAWIGREAGVDWRARKLGPPWRNEPGFRVCLCQWQKLHGPEAAEEFLDYAQSLLKTPLLNWRHADWAKLSKELGKELRKKG